MVTNCLVYTDDKTCLKCVQDYFLSNNKCVKSNLRNCEIFDTIDSCSKCLDGYGLQNVSGKNTCKEISIPNCLEAVVEEGVFKCNKCDIDFFVDTSGKCATVANDDKITSCVTYKTKDTCASCRKNTILSKDQKTCYSDTKYTKLLPFNCDSAYET